MRTNFDEVLSTKEMSSIKWNSMKNVDKRANDETLAFWIADMDFACSEKILAAIKNRLDRKILGYAIDNVPEYIEAVRKWYKADFDWDFDATDIFYSPGVVMALASAVNFLTAKGDGVIIQRPVYSPFTKVIVNNGRKVVNNRLIKDENNWYTIDFDDFEQKCKENKLFILCSPHNPVGRVWTEEELRKIGTICQKHNVTVISDEIHCDLTRNGVKHRIFQSLFADTDFKDNIITCTAPSKSFNIAGLSHSNIIISGERLKEQWRNHSASIGLPHATPLGLAATEAAYNQGKEWLLEAKTYIDQNLNYIDNFIKTRLPKVKFCKPDGTYLTWIDFGAYGTSEEVYGMLLEKCNIMVQRGTDFGLEEGEGFVRFNAACPRVLLEKAFAAIEKCLN